MILTLDERSLWFAKMLDTVRVAPPYRCGTLTHDNVNTALTGHPQGLNRWLDPRFAATRDDIIKADKPESTYSKAKD